MPKKSQAQEQSFEQLYNELETTIEKLEQGNLDLDAALALYERGIELARQSGALLDRAELRIQELAPTSILSDDATADDGPDLDLDEDDDA